MFEEGKYWSTEEKKKKKEKENNIWKGEKNGPQWRRRTEKEKEEIILRRKFNGEANQPTGWPTNRVNKVHSTFSNIRQ